MPRKSRSKAATIIFGVLISALCFWLVLKDVDREAFEAAIRQTNLLLLALAIAAATICFPLRIPRWRLLLPEEPGKPIPTSSLWHAVSIGFTANNIIAGRLGEVIRAATLTRLTSIPFPTAFASLAVERLLDGLVVIALLGVGLVGSGFSADKTLPDGTSVTAQAGRMGLFCLVFLTLAMVAAWQSQWTLKLLRRIMPGGNIAEKLLHFIERILEGLGALRDPRRAIPVIAWSFALWLLNAASFWLGLQAFGIDLSFFSALVLQGVVVVYIAIPGAPGGLGPFELGVKSALGFYGIDPDLSAAYALGFHICTMPPILLLGAWSMRRIGATFKTSMPVDEAPPA